MADISSSMSKTFAKILPGKQVHFHITGFSQGSIVAHYEMFVFQEPSDLDLQKLANDIREEVRKENISGLILTSDQNAFIFNDKDECLNDDDNDCSVDALCANTVGSFTCECNSGYQDMSDGTGRNCQLKPSSNDAENRVIDKGFSTSLIAAFAVTATLLLGLAIFAFAMLKKNHGRSAKVVPFVENQTRQDEDEPNPNCDTARKYHM